MQLTASYGSSSLQLLCAHSARGLGNRTGSKCTKVTSVDMPAPHDENEEGAEDAEALVLRCKFDVPTHVYGGCSVTASGGKPSTLFVVVRAQDDLSFRNYDT